MEYDVEEVIDKLEALGYVRPYRRTGNWYQVACPFHNNGQEKKPSCGILLHDEYKNGSLYKQGTWHCFACGYSGDMPHAITDLFKLRGITTSGLDWMKENVPGFAGTDFKVDSLLPDGMLGDVMDKFAADNLKLKFQAKKVNYVSEEELASYRFTVPYMYERKLTDEIIAKYDVGFDANHIPPGRKKPLPCITFPVRDIYGRTLFFCRRSVEGKYFNYPEGVSKPVYGVYELPRDAKSVIVCESVFNCLTAVAYGFNAVALLGTGNSEQIKQLKRLGVREYVLCMDGDPAGRKATAKLSKALSDCAIVWKIEMPDGVDLNQCTYDEFIQLYNARN